MDCHRAQSDEFLLVPDVSEGHTDTHHALWIVTMMSLSSVVSKVPRIVEIFHSLITFLYDVVRAVKWNRDKVEETNCLDPFLNSALDIFILYSLHLYPTASFLHPDFHVSHTTNHAYM